MWFPSVISCSTESFIIFLCYFRHLNVIKLTLFTSFPVHSSSLYMIILLPHSLLNNYIVDVIILYNLLKIIQFVRFYFLMVISFKVAIFWVMTPCNLVDTCVLGGGKPGICLSHFIIIIIIINFFEKPK